MKNQDEKIKARLAKLIANTIEDEDEGDYFDDIDFDDVDDSDVTEYIEEQEDNFSGDLADFAFREAIRQRKTLYIKKHAEDFDLNDEGEYSTYIYETDNPRVQDLLIEFGAFRNEDDYCKCRFAAGAFDDSLIAFDKDFQGEVFEKYLETYGITRGDVIAMFDDADAADSFDDEKDRCFVDDMEALGVVVENGEIVLKDDISALASVTRDLIEELGWECDFEGDRDKFETRGVYFIK